jgi:hypothetical protein
MDTRQQISLSIAQEFSKIPGPRTRAEGEHSAEEFLDTILEFRFDEAVRSHAVLYIDLDGGFGYGTSFLEEAFGGLARRKKNAQLVIDHIDFKSDEEPYLRDDVLSYIREALTGRPKKQR